MQKEVENIYLTRVLSQVPRLLSSLNRSPLSGTYGSLDREHWLLHTSDIPNARKQEAIWFLALLYSSNFKGNIYYKDQQILKWINAGLDYLIKIQHDDGSFDELFYNERSFVCTSFVLVAVAQCALLFKNGELVNRNKIESLLRKASDYVLNEYESVASNQTAGNILALVLTSQVLGEDAYKEHASLKLERFLLEQNEEGWWSEYGGPDIGYLSLTVDYLKLINVHFELGKVGNAIEKAVNFLSYFLHPNFTAGGEYGYRDTGYVVPSGHRLFQEFGARALEAGTATWPGSMSDDYMLTMLSHWLRAGLTYRPGEELLKVVLENDVERNFKNSRLFVKRSKNYYIAYNTNKGGAFTLVSNVGHYSDSGAIVEIKEISQTPILGLLFKISNLIFGPLKFFRSFLKRYLRKQLIFKRPIYHERIFKFDKNEVTIIGRHGEKAAYGNNQSSRFLTLWN